MGLSDYGFNGINQYTYTTSEVQSLTTFDRLYIGSFTCPPKSSCNSGMTLQLNAVTNGVIENSNAGTYWTQDVAAITQNNAFCNIFGCFPTTYTIQFLDNIWNFTTSTAGMNGPITGNLLGKCSGGIGSSSGTNFYFCVGPTFTTTLPFTIVLTTIVDVNPTNGDSRVGFFYEVASPTVLSSGGYDTVDFSSNFAGSPTYSIGGTAPNGIPSDLENIIGGGAGGALVQMNTINAFMNLEFESASGLALVPHAWSAGGETGEDVSNVYVFQAFPSTGQAVSGADDFIQLW
jgi:hypothetical protein